MATSSHSQSVCPTMTEELCVRITNSKAFMAITMVTPEMLLRQMK